MKKSRIKYSKTNKRFNQLVNNIDSIRQLNIGYNNLKEKQLKQMILLQAEIENKYDIENIFIEIEELYKFFSSTSINLQSDIAQQVYYSLKNRKCVDECFENKKTPFRLYAFRLFAPINLIPTSLAVCISCTQTFNEGNILNYITLSDSNSSQDLMLHKKGIEYLENGLVMINNDITRDEYSKKLLEYYRVILNLIFYMNAFPENVLKGVPERAIIDVDNIISDKKITISKNIKLFKNHEISPHLRRGHWRTFTSDYYKNKKGETIWIDPIYIKGEALTVIEGNTENV
ncbi:MAG: hypothetical protein FWD87_11320 [Spirochaetaceae bacterium]|nr:hypothetical protein [Spirochaetaceae bacterium]